MLYFAKINRKIINLEQVTMIDIKEGGEGYVHTSGGQITLLTKDEILQLIGDMSYAATLFKLQKERGDKSE